MARFVKSDSVLGRILADKHTTRQVEVGLPGFKTQLNSAHRRAAAGRERRAGARRIAPDAAALAQRRGQAEPRQARLVETYTRENRGPRKARTVVEPIRRADFSIFFKYAKGGAQNLTADKLGLAQSTFDEIAQAVQHGDMKAAAAAFTKGQSGRGVAWYRERFREIDSRAAGGNVTDLTGGSAGGGDYGDEGDQGEDYEDEGYHTTRSRRPTTTRSLSADLRVSHSSTGTAGWRVTGQGPFTSRDRGRTELTCRRHRPASCYQSSCSPPSGPGSPQPAP